MLWWTTQSLMISAALAAIVWIVCRLRRIGPVARHALWLIVLLKLLTPPLFAWPWAIHAPFVRLDRHAARSPSEPPFANAKASDADVLADPSDNQETPAPSPLSWASESRAPSGMRTATSAPPRATPPIPPTVSPDQLIGRLLPLATAAWIIGTVTFALLQLLRIIRMLAQARCAVPPDRKLADRVAVESARLRLGHVHLRTIRGISSPMIWSLWRPCLLWPAQFSDRLSDDSLTGLIVHELAHIRRRDHLVGWLELLAGCIWWWNPLYWYVRHQLRENAELACDGWVVNLLPHGRRAYGEALLSICEFMSRQAAPMPAVGINTGGRRFLERRLAMILRERIPLRLPRLGLLAVGLLATLTLPAWSQKITQQIEPPRDGAEREVGGEYGANFFSRVAAARFAQPPPPLPAGAQEILDQFSGEQAEIQREADEKIAQSRELAIEHLKAMQDQFTKAGQLDEAVAIRDRIRQMQSLASRSRRPLTDPGNLVTFRDRVGQSFLFTVRGRTDQTVWGSEVYTDDSSLAAAAVHAGILKNDEEGIVRVTMLPPMQSYQGSERNGITSQSYGPWQGSYRVEQAQPLHAYRSSQPVTLTHLRDHVGEVFVFNVVGSNSGTIWGDEVYTDDSPVAVAAVHAGLLRPGQRGTVSVKILPGQAGYAGASHNGVTSQPYAAWEGSYTFVNNNRGGPRFRNPPGEIPGGGSGPTGY